MHKVIVSLTTVPGRINKLQPTLQSLLKQNVYKIVINVPLTYKKWPSVAITIPAFMNHPRILINRKCTDLGPITKVLGAVACMDHDALLVYVDDDHVYSTTFIESHVRAHTFCSKTVFAGRGSILNVPHSRTLLQKPWFQIVHTADGVQGVSVQVSDVNWKQLTEAALAWHQNDPLSILADDIVLSRLFYEQGLTIRIAPVAQEAIPLKHAGDEFALCNGSDTTERYWNVINNLKSSTEWLDNISTGLPYLSIPKLSAGPVGIAVFAYQRPNLLERVLASLVPQARDIPIHLFLDGIIHPVTGALEGTLKLWHQNITVFKKWIPHGHVHAAPTNHGVGVMQHAALDYMASTYEYVIMLEDDLVLGPTYIESLWNMRSLCRGAIGSIQAGYRKEHGEPHLIQLTRAAAEHIHYWGWMTSACAYAQIKDIYDSAVAELFKDRYYRRRDFAAIKQWFIRNSITDNGHYSQDWVRDACFQLAGMPFKLYTPCRRGVPVGRDGLHSSSAMFDAMKLDDNTADVQRVPALDLQKAILTWDRALPIRAIQSVMPSVLGQPYTVLPPATAASAKVIITNKRRNISDLLDQITSFNSERPCSLTQS